MQRHGFDPYCAAAALVAAMPVLAQGGWFSPFLDILTHFAVLYGVIGVIVGLGALATSGLRRGTLLTLSLVTLAASAALMAPEALRSTGPVAAPGTANTIKVIQFNALRTNRDIDRIMAWLQAEDADVITVTETQPELRQRLIQQMKMNTAGMQSHLMIFTPKVYLQMDRPGISRASELTFINATYASTSGPMEVVTAHFSWPTSPDFAPQVAALKSVIAVRPRDRMILTGDLNAAPWSFTIRRLDESLGLIRRDRGGATFPAQILGRRWPLPFLAIDHVYAGPGWATVKVERGPWLGSDHYPLIVTLAPVTPP